MIEIDGEYRADYTKGKFWDFVLKIREKPAARDSTEKIFYLISWISLQSLVQDCSYRISPTTIYRIAKGTTQVLWNILFEKISLDPSNSGKEWLQVEKRFKDKSNFPHCLGTIDFILS